MQKQEFLQLVAGNKGPIRALCSSYYASLEDREDAFQDIVLQLWKGRDSFRGDANISTWIFRISINTLLSKKRKEKKKIATNPIEPTIQWDGASYADDHNELLHMILRSLKDLDKAIILLYLEGYQNKEIATMLGISFSNVSTRLHRIKSALKRKFKPHFYES